MELTYDGEGWVGFGFSTTGRMVGSEAVMYVCLSKLLRALLSFLLTIFRIENVSQCTPGRGDGPKVQPRGVLPESRDAHARGPADPHGRQRRSRGRQDGPEIHQDHEGGRGD